MSKAYVKDLELEGGFKRTYTGDVVNKIPNGKGKITYFEGTAYAGLKIAEGIFVNGNLIEGKKVYELGIIEEGTFHESSLVKGKLISNKGVVFEGEFINNYLYGKGKIDYSNYIDEGIFSRSYLCDKGIRIYKNHPEYKRYEGHFLCNKPHGYGKLIYNDGKVKEGIFDRGNLTKNNHYNNKIKITDDDCKYEGEYCDNAKNGYGRYTIYNEYSLAKNIIYEGFWVYNKLEGQGKIYSKDMTLLYNGLFVDGKPYGHATLKNVYGDVMEGFFVNGLLEGNGKVTFSNKSTIEGNFHEGRVNSLFCTINYHNKYKYTCDENSNFYIDYFNGDSTYGNYKDSIVTSYIKNEAYFGKAHIVFDPYLSYEDIDGYLGIKCRLTDKPFAILKNSGKGIKMYSDGSLCKGTWENNIDMIGKSKFFSTKGEIYIGKIENEKKIENFIEGKIYYGKLKSKIIGKYIKKIDNRLNVYEGNRTPIISTSTTSCLSNKYITYSYGKECIALLNKSNKEGVNLKKMRATEWFSIERNGEDLINKYYKYVLTHNSYSVFEIVKYEGISKKTEEYHWENHGSHAGHGSGTYVTREGVSSKVKDIKLILNIDINKSVINNLPYYKSKIKDVVGSDKYEICIWGLNNLCNEDSLTEDLDMLLAKDIKLKSISPPKTESLKNKKSGLLAHINKIIRRNYTIFENKESYRGKSLDDKKHGKGCYKWSNGLAYEGDFEFDKINGNGILKLNNTVVYSGQFKNGIIDGVGKITYDDGTVYEGEFKNGFRHGFGKMMYKNGYVYEGNFVKGLKDGYGTLYYGKEILYNCEWVLSSIKNIEKIY